MYSRQKQRYRPDHRYTYTILRPVQPGQRSVCEQHPKDTRNPADQCCRNGTDHEVNEVRGDAERGTRPGPDSGEYTGYDEDSPWFDAIAPLVILRGRYTPQLGYPGRSKPELKAE